ncbi:hypothetical protein EIP91_008312 [Steccherinum ochraceum]|uniref:Zn-dependent exopeptidase n=1 Tax=Steccherinum ochraceum TaxID=92696 RepID=A0A4R0RU38_9APHY|nr:hypothetical protein EIP91_008312 [Steccherinum ochraceum]
MGAIFGSSSEWSGLVSTSCRHPDSKKLTQLLNDFLYSLFAALNVTMAGEKHQVGETDLEGQAEIPKTAASVEKTAWPRIRRGWVPLAALAVYICFRASVKTWLYEQDVQDLHSHWTFQAFGGNKLDSTKKVEELFLSVPNAKSALANSRKYATHPHLAGSKEDFEDAKVMLKLFQDQFGIPASSDIPLYPAGSAESRSSTLDIHKLTKPTAWIDEYYPVMNTGKEVGLEILGEDGKPVWTAELVEDGDPADPEAAKYRNAVPTWHGFSANGDVAGEIIYANYGSREDYDNLLSVGTNFTGKIVLVRNGVNTRGPKVEGAQELGAAGVIIYSDPRDDGSVTVENGYKPYPAGPARNPTAVERGTVQLYARYPGDPTTPGYPAYENATRTESGNVPKIPSIPISWANAQKLLAEIGDVTVSRKLTGISSTSKIRLVNKVDFKVIPIWNTMAVIPGHIKSETVIVGCHRDAWVMGAADPVSGMVSLAEVVRAYGTLLKSGWRPLRNILIANWDAEEYGLVGSTEWGEDFAEWIQEQAVSYINVDISVGGSTLIALGSPSLAHLIRRTAQDIPHPSDPKRTLWDATKDSGPFSGAADADFMAMHNTVSQRRAASTGVQLLSSGSDFTVFLQRLGVASMDQTFVQSPTDAAYHYHSIYDSQHWMEKYGDPTFERHVAVGKNLGLIALRLADSIILPLNTTQYALELDDYLDFVEALTLAPYSKLRKSIHKLQRASAKLDEEKVKAEQELRELLNKVHRKSHGCNKSILRRVIRWIKHVVGSRGLPIRKLIKAAKRVQKANTKLVAFERGFLAEDGISSREWYKHLGVAPGKWLGNSATTFPALTEALTLEKNITLAHHEAHRLTELFDKLTIVLES